jgi:Raf kinase inhibitor-like YbhB/YbcL family protein
MVAALAGCTSAPPTGAATPPVVLPTTNALPTTLTVTSPAFAEGATIPTAYTCAGAGQMPAISWSGDLAGSNAIAIVVDDPDAPNAPFVHLIVVDLPPTATSLGATLPAGARYALNSADKPGWTPPCPPSGTHHYRFTVFGLNSPTGLGDGESSFAARGAINAKAIVQGRLTGTVSH